jgi:hypothetical protein
MSRHEAIATINAKLGVLPDEQIEALAGMVQSLSEGSVFASLSKADRAALDDAVDSLDRGEGIELATVDAELEAKLRAAGV